MIYLIPKYKLDNSAYRIVSVHEKDLEDSRNRLDSNSPMEVRACHLTADLTSTFQHIQVIGDPVCLWVMCGQQVESLSLFCLEFLVFYSEC